MTDYAFVNFPGVDFETLDQPSLNFSNNCPPCSQDIDCISSIVASVFHVPDTVLFDRSRGRARHALARQFAMYLMHVCCGKSYTEVGRAFGRDRTTVAYACQVIEDRRETPEVDWCLNLIEQSFLLMRSQHTASGE